MTPERDATLAPFPIDEFGRRVDRARALMDEARLDALMITAEVNFRYFTGFDSPTWVSPTRPLFLVVPAEGVLHAVVPSGALAVLRAAGTVARIDHWPAPVPDDDGVSQLVEALLGVHRRYGRIGAELGFEQHLRMPLLDYLRVAQRIAPVTLVDGGAVLKACRMIKSAGEVARIERAARLTSAALHDLPRLLHAGMTEREACRLLQIDLLRRGADRSGYLVAASGQDGYDTISRPASDRALQDGDLFVIDTGTVVDAYFCDFDRNYQVGGSPTDAVLRLNDALYDATEAGLKVCVPGARCADVWRAMAGVLGEERVRSAAIGRMGHGLGLQLTEQPSIHPDDQTVLAEGMVLTLEPSAGYVGRDGRDRLLVHEENLVVTGGGARLLSERGSRDFIRIG